jgi:Ser/Thr protein kinase RdoA (MazF antagonist)
MNIITKPKVEDWRDDKYKRLAQNSKNYLLIAIEEGLLDGRQVTKGGVISDGDSSIVYYVETNDNRYIVKFAPSKGDLITHKLFSDRWSERGVKTPTIYKIREADEQIPYELALIEFIEANTLSKTYTKKELHEKGYYGDLGTTLAKMHRAKGEGYRKLKVPNVLVGKYNTLSGELDYDIKQKRLDKLIERRYVSNTVEQNYQQAKETLEKNMTGKMPSLCHNDFLPYNIMATDPITVFDPSPSISSPLKDLGSTVGKILLKDNSYIKEAAKQLVTSYESESSEMDYEALNAAIYISYIRKIPRAIISGDNDKANQLISLVEGGIVDYLD